MSKIETTYKVFLDDVRNVIDVRHYIGNNIYLDSNWLVVRNYNEFVNAIMIGYNNYNVFPYLISFDHDLADEHYSKKMHKKNHEYNSLYEKFNEKTGYDCAKWLVEFCIDNSVKLPKFLIHSMNPVGGENIKQYLNNYLYHENKNI